MEVNYRVGSNRPIAKDVWELKLFGDNSRISRPGQFVNLRIDGCYLRRPLSVCAVDGDRLTLIYKVVGKGTEILSRMREGSVINALTGLGNGFDVSAGGASPLLIGGGVGVPPMYQLCRELIAGGSSPIVALGFHRAEDVFYQKEFSELGAEVHLATADGSLGTKGFVTELVKPLQYTFFYACGPEAMFRALEAVLTTPGEYSFEERMGCGFGACMGCSIETLKGPKRICKEGPVFESKELLWED